MTKTKTPRRNTWQYTICTFPGSNHIWHGFIWREVSRAD